MDAAAELGKNPVSKHQIQPGYGDEQANAGRDCQARPARPNSPTIVGVEKRGAHKLVHGDLARQQSRSTIGGGRDVANLSLFWEMARK